MGLRAHLGSWAVASWAIPVGILGGGLFYYRQYGLSLGSVLRWHFVLTLAAFTISAVLVALLFSWVTTRMGIAPDPPQNDDRERRQN